MKLYEFTMETQFLVVIFLWTPSVVTANFTITESDPLSCEARLELLDGHNSRRWHLLDGKVPGQPTAARMQLMMWDLELAAKAESWASQNIFEYNPERRVGSGRFTTGENIYSFSTMNMTYVFDYEKALTVWWDEHKDFTFKKLDSSMFGNGKKKIGHYTQMAWAKSTYLGCGLSISTTDEWKNFFLVCDYAPAGNYMGSTPYVKGNSTGEMFCYRPGCMDPYTGCSPDEPEENHKAKLPFLRRN